MGSITIRNPQHPNTTKTCIWTSQACLSPYKMELFPPHEKEIRLPSPWGLSQLWTWIIPASIIDITLVQSHCCVLYLKIIDLPLKLTSGWWSLEMINHATYALTIYLNMERTLCMLRLSLYNSIGDRCPNLSQNIPLRSFKPYFPIEPSSIYQHVSILGHYIPIP